MKRVYVDTEYCYPGMERGTPRPTAADKRQIVQIAAIIFDTDSGKEIAHFNQLVLPTYTKKVPEFFVELTGITQADVDRSGIPFKDALANFVRFVGDTEVWTFDKDEEVFRQNCGYLTLPWPFTSPFVRVKALLPHWGINPAEYSSGTLYKTAGLKMDGHVHNALHDVRSMAQAIYTFETQPSR